MGNFKYLTRFNGYADNPRTGETYEARIGEPDVVSSGIGAVVIGFSYLEDLVDAAISVLLRTDERAAQIVGAELAFKAKVNVLASLVRERADHTFNSGPHKPVEVFREMVTLLNRAEELRNTVMHSSWHHVPGLAVMPPNAKQRARRRKRTAKARHGLQTIEQAMTGGDLLDVYDFCLNVAVELEEFFQDDDLHSRTHRIIDIGLAE